MLKIIALQTTNLFLKLLTYLLECIRCIDRLFVDVSIIDNQELIKKTFKNKKQPKGLFYTLKRDPIFVEEVFFF